MTTGGNDECYVGRGGGGDIWDVGDSVGDGQSGFGGPMVVSLEVAVVEIVMEAMGVMIVVATMVMVGVEIVVWVSVVVVVAVLVWLVVGVGWA